MKIRRKSIIFKDIEVTECKEEAFYTDMTGEHKVPIGDYIVHHEDGSKSALSKTAFNECFDIIGEE